MLANSCTGAVDALRLWFMLLHTLKRTDGASKTMFYILKRKRVLRGREVIGFDYRQNRLEVDMELSKVNTPKDLFSLLKESQQRGTERRD